MAFILSIVLARVLLPEQYGTISLVLVFINLANVFVTSGFGESLIQEKDSSDREFSTMFYCSIVMSIALYILLYLTAPQIARFYKNDQLIPIIRVLSLQVPLGGIKTIQNAYIIKNMMFKKFFFSTLGGTFISGMIGIMLAFKGFGVWALVAQNLTNSIIDMLVLFIIVPWRPTCYFNFQIAKNLFAYGWKLTVAQFLNTFYGNIRNLFIGKIYSEVDLAYYNRGDQFPNLIINNINTSISTVLFPAMVLESVDTLRLKSLTRRAMKTSSYLVFPIMTGLMAVSEPLIRVLLTDKWLPAVPYLFISCVYWMFQPSQTANAQVIKALGESSLYLKLEIIKKIIGMGLLIGSLRYGVLMIAISNIALAMISMLINIFPNKRLIHYGYFEQIGDLLPTLVISILMGVIVYFEKMLPVNILLLLIIQMVSGVLIYLGLSIISRNDSYLYLKKFGLEKINYKKMNN